MLRGAARLLRDAIAQWLQRPAREARRLKRRAAEHAGCWQHGRQGEAVAHHRCCCGVDEVEGGTAVAMLQRQCGVVAVLVADGGHVGWKSHVD